MATDNPIPYFPVDDALLKRLDDFRFKHHFEIPAEAVPWLVTWAMDQKTKVEKV